jgi:hypothetical protein
MVFRLFDGEDCQRRRPLGLPFEGRFLGGADLGLELQFEVEQRLDQGKWKSDRWPSLRSLTSIIRQG